MAFKPPPTPTAPIEEWAAWVKEGRQRLGLSKAALARALEVGEETVERWEKA